MPSPRRFALAVFLALICGLGQASTARAQVFELIASFTGCTPDACPVGGDLGLPNGALHAAPGGLFYGVLTADPRIADVSPYLRAIYRIDTAGNRVILHRFTGEGASGCFSDSMTVTADGTVYGVAFSCDGSAGSTIFRIVGTSFEVVQQFPPGGGFNPSSLYAGPGGAFYGLGADSSGDRVLYKWDGAIQVLGPGRGNGFDLLFASFVRARDGNLYFPLGLFNFFGSSGGAVLRISSGGRIEAIHEFSDGQSPSGTLLAGSDGNLYGISVPFSGAPSLYRLTLSGEVTYPSASFHARPLAAWVDGSVFLDPGSVAHGNIERLTPSGESVPIHTFDGTDGSGRLPQLTEGPDGHFYGVRGEGGANGLGVFYRIRMPNLDVKANGGDGPTTVAPSDSLAISVAFDAAPSTTIDPSEVYVAVVTPTLEVLWMTPSGFSATPARLYSGPLGAFGSTPLLTIPDVSALSEGDYYWVTIVDADSNGVPNGMMVDFVKTTRLSAVPARAPL
jgi:hypothetical protein